MSPDPVALTPEADLVRDVCCDLHKAATKLSRSGRRSSAVARKAVLTKAEAKLAAANRASGSAEG